MYANHRGPGYDAGWCACPTCKQNYTGAMQRGMAEALWERLKDRPAEDEDRLGAQTILAIAYKKAFCRVGSTLPRRPCHRAARAWPNDTNTLVNLGNALLDQGKHSDAEAVLRDTLERQRAVLGPEHEDTLHTATNLATSLQKQRKDAEAEPLVRATLAIQQRTLGDGHIDTLYTATNLAVLLSNFGQHTEAEALGRSALAQANHTLGPDHPDTPTIASILAIILVIQGQAAEAEALFTATLATQQRVLGPGHPDTQTTVEVLRRLQQRG